jgi:hypothetical protein
MQGDGRLVVPWRRARLNSATARAKCTAPPCRQAPPACPPTALLARRFAFPALKPAEPFKALPPAAVADALPAAAVEQVRCGSRPPSALPHCLLCIACIHVRTHAARADAPGLQATRNAPQRILPGLAWPALGAHVVNDHSANGRLPLCKVRAWHFLPPAASLAEAGMGPPMRACPGSPSPPPKHTPAGGRGLCCLEAPAGSVRRCRRTRAALPPRRRPRPRSRAVGQQPRPLLVAQQPL